MASKIVIAVTGEGKTDYGISEYNKKKAVQEWKWGPIAEYCEMLDLHI